MKINIIIPFTNLTGGIRVMFLHANYLVSKGHDVRVYVPVIAYKTNKNFLKRVKATIGNIVKRSRKVSWFNCNFCIYLVPFISNVFIRNADISIATAWCTAKDVYNFDLIKGEKVYFIQDYEVWSGNKRDVDKSYTLDMNRIVITKTLQELLLKKFNVTSTLIYNGLDEKEFLNSKKVINNKKVILMLYNKSSNKGTEEGIEVLKRIYNKNKVRVILFGFPKRGDDIPIQFEYYENPPRNELIELYRCADIYLFPSKQEAWGLPVLEAMSNKCAVIGKSVGCLKELGLNFVNSIVVNNYDEMEIGLEKLINNTSLLKRIQENGYDLSKKFSWKNSNDKLERFLFNLVNGDDSNDKSDIASI